MLKYLLAKSPMATDPKNCIAVVSSTENKNLNDVISKMIAEGTGLTRPLTVYTVIKPSEVHFQIPTLDTGEYYVTVKNLSKPGNPIRTAQLKTTILV